MKIISLICAALLLIAVVNLPIVYYTILRYIITVGALAAVFLKAKKTINFWDITFIIIALIFNPMIPIYINSKSSWIIIDLLVAALFLIFAFREEKVV